MTFSNERCETCDAFLPLKADGTVGPCALKVCPTTGADSSAEFGEGFWARYARMRVTREALAKAMAKTLTLRCRVRVCGLEHGHAGDCFPSPIGFYGQTRGASCE